jgi:hypothetical protein
VSIKDIDVWEMPLADTEVNCIKCSARYSRPEFHDTGLCFSCIKDAAQAHILHYIKSSEYAAKESTKIPEDTTSAGGQER